QRGGAGITQVFRGNVEEALRVRVRVDRRQDAALDTEFVEQHLGNRRQAVGRARCVGNNRVFARIVALLIDAKDDGDVFVLCGCGNDDLLRARIDVSLGLGRIGEQTRRFNDNLRAELLPRNAAWIALGGDIDLASVDDE